MDVVAAVVAALVPAWMFTGPVGPFRAPGLESDGLYGALLSGAVARGWLVGETLPGTTGVLSVEDPYWPASPLGALAQAVLPFDPGFALGITMAVAVWLAAFGPWRLARVALPDAPPWAAMAAGLVVQVSPVVLRGVPVVDLGAVLVGALALGLAHPAWALLGGLASGPGSIFFALCATIGGGWRVAMGRPLGAVAGWALAALPALALALPASSLPGAMRRADSAHHVGPAYLTEAGALFPLPPVEADPIRDTEHVSGTGLWLAPGLTPVVRSNPFAGDGAPPVPGAEYAPPVPGDGAPPVPGATPVPSVPGAAPTLPGGQAIAFPGGEPAPGAAGAVPPAGAPMPAGVAAASAAPPAAPDAGLHRIGAVLLPFQRLHGGPVVVLGLLAGLLLRGARRFSLAGLGVLGLVTAILGWQAAPGELERHLLAVEQLRVVLSSAQLAAVPGGVLAWGAPVAVLAVPGLAALFGWLLPAVPRAWAAAPRFLAGGLCGFVLLAAGVPLENPRLAVPVASLPPDPLVDTLRSIEPGGVLLFPSPAPPFFMGQEPWGRVLWELARAGRATDAAGTPGHAALVRALVGLCDVPVDVSAARVLWEARALEAFPAAVAGGWRYLLVDLRGVPSQQRPRLDGYLAERVGMPIARENDRLLYDLTAGPVDGPPASGLPKFGEPPPGMPPLGTPPEGSPPMGTPPAVAPSRGTPPDGAAMPASLPTP